MARKCSHCGNMGHNLRTCIIHKRSIVGNFRLFGMQLNLFSSSSSSSFVMRKSFSIDGSSSRLTTSSSTPSSSTPSSSSSSSNLTMDGKFHQRNAYISNGIIARNRERKKGVLWTEEEHRAFLAGLEKLGKGDWRGISRNFVTTRTPTQVASHAQKYFLRQNSLHKRKRRPSLFDVGMAKFTSQLVSTSVFEPSTEASVPFGFSSKKTSSAVLLDSTKLQPGEIGHYSDQWPSSHNSMPTTFSNVFESLPTSDLTKPTLQSAAPHDLELTLATPRPLDRRK